MYDSINRKRKPTNRHLSVIVDIIAYILRNETIILQAAMIFRMPIRHIVDIICTQGDRTTLIRL